MTREFIEKTLSDIVEIPSLSGNEEKVADYIFAHLEKSGLSPQRDDDANVWVEVGSGKRLLHVNGHTDTVVAVQGWETDPHKATLKDGRLYGLGSTDCGAGLAAMLWLAPRVRPNVRVIFSWTVCEEGIRNSKINGSRRMADMGGDWAIAVEPSSCYEGPGISLGTQGHARAVVTFPGRAAHSSRPELGDNAVYRACRFCLEIEQLDAQFEEIHVYEDIFARPSVAATVMNGGKLSNIIPDSCQVTVSRRLAPGENRPDFEAEINGLIGSSGASAEFFGDGPCATVDINGSLFATAKAAGEDLCGEARFAWQRGRTDGVIYAGKGMDTLTVGPGIIGQSHMANEHIDLDIAAQSTALLEQIINTLPDKA